MRKSISIALIVAALVMGPTVITAISQEDGGAILGVWTPDNGKARVEITMTEENTFEGKIIWLKEPQYPAGDPEAGKDKHDRNNPDAALRDKPTLGLRLLKGFTFDGKGLWSGGTIYDPENGKTYKCKITADGEDRLNVRGFIGISLIGRTSVWTRYTEGK